MADPFVPSAAIDLHHHFTPMIRDNIRWKLEAAAASVSRSSYRLLTPPLLRRLALLNVPSAPILSLYLQLTPDRRVGRAWHAAFANLSKAMLNRLVTKPERVSVEEALGRIEQALEAELPRIGRGVAFFVGRESGLWQQVAIALPLPDAVYLSPTPFIRPLLRMRDAHDRFVLAILSPARSRFFISQTGLVEEVFRVTSNHQRAVIAERSAHDRINGGMTQALGVEGRILAHVIGALAELADTRHIVLCGTDDIRSSTVRALPRALAPKAGDEFAVELKAAPHEIAMAAEPTLRAIEEREDTQILQRIIEAGAHGAAWGEGPTLDALREGRVMVLAVDDRGSIAGARCRSCGSLYDAPRPDCARCRSENIEPVDDLLELAIERALAQNAALEIVRSEGGRRLMGTRWNMAALLRG